MITLTHAFGLSREPFLQDIPADKQFPLPGFKAFIDRFDYAIHVGAATVITGHVGSGKPTSLIDTVCRCNADFTNFSTRFLKELWSTTCKRAD